jgi:hypothetical protein
MGPPMATRDGTLDFPTLGGCCEGEHRPRARSPFYTVRPPPDTGKQQVSSSLAVIDPGGSDPRAQHGFAALAAGLRVAAGLGFGAL